MDTQNKTAGKTAQPFNSNVRSGENGYCWSCKQLKPMSKMGHMDYDEEEGHSTLNGECIECFDRFNEEEEEEVETEFKNSILKKMEFLVMTVEELCITKKQAIELKSLGWNQNNSLLWINKISGAISTAKPKTSEYWCACPTITELMDKADLHRFEVEGDSKGVIAVYTMFDGTGKNITEALANLIIALVKSGNLKLGDGLPF